jgi:hypothetical protein
MTSTGDIAGRIEYLERLTRETGELLAELKSAREERDYWRNVVEKKDITAKSETPKYLVEMLFSHGWDDANWTHDDSPWRFDSIEEAQAEIDDLCRTFHDDPLFMHKPSDFRVVAT